MGQSSYARPARAVRSDADRSTLAPCGPRHTPSGPQSCLASHPRRGLDVFWVASTCNVCTDCSCFCCSSSPPCSSPIAQHGDEAVCSERMSAPLVAISYFSSNLKHSCNLAFVNCACPRLGSKGQLKTY